MRVLAYLHYYPPHRFVGGEMMTARLLEHLAGLGHEVDVFTQYVNEKYERNGVGIRPARLLRRAATAGKYDVLVTHPEIRAVVRSVTRKMPYVGVVHNLNPHTVRPLQRRPPDIAVTSSEFTRQQLPPAARASSCVIHPPVFATDDPPIGSPKLTVVNFSADKGGEVLARVARNNGTQAFRAVAGGHGEQIWAQPRNVQMVPPQERMGPVYAGASALLMPSRSETYGMVVAEAIMAGVPVIASDLPGVREAGGRAPEYVAPDDYEGWDHWVKKLADPAVRKRLASRSRKQAGALARRTEEDLKKWADLVAGTVELWPWLTT